MWDPDFSGFERNRAKLAGFRRSFCIWTAHARGTPDAPGLGLGLRREAGATCAGVAITLNCTADRACLDALWEREMWTGIYRPEWVNAVVGQASVPALAFVVDEDHPQFAGNMPLAEAARLIARAEGTFGTCRDYFFETVRALQEWTDLPDEFAELEALLRAELSTRPPGDRSG